MKKTLYILIIIVSILGCNKNKNNNIASIKDSLVIVYGFKNFSIDDSIIITYDSFKQYKDSFIAVYDTDKHIIVFMRNVCNCKYGDCKINNNGDTVYCVEDGYEKYVSSDEWYEYYEKYK